MLTYLFLIALLAITEALPRDIVDKAIIRNGLTNVDISKIVEKSAENFEGVKIALDEVEDKVVDYNFIVEVSGPLTLTNGHLNISSYRVCDKITRITSYNYEIPLRFKLLEFEYHYDAKVGWLTQYGDVVVKIYDLEITLPVDFENNQFTLKDIQPFKYRDIEVIFENGSIVTAIFNTLSSIFEDVIVHLLEDIYAEFLLINVTKKMNEVLARV